MRVLYHLWLSPCARKVRIVLREKNLDFTLKAEKVWERRPEFLALNPACEVPVLIEPDGTVLADTAAIVDRLDGVVSIDTAVAHLTGALGKPLWLMLPFAADWRWGIDTVSTPWYPKARLFRQPKPGAWEAVIERVAGDIGAS